MLKAFEIELIQPIKIKIGGDEKIVKKIEIRKPIAKYRNLYIDFYQELTKSLISIRPSKEDSDKAKEIEIEKDKKDEEEKFDQKMAIVLGSMHLSDTIIKKLFKFLEIGDSENPSCLVFGEKIQQLELDLLKDQLEDIDISAIVGGIINNFLPLMQLKI